MKNWTKVLEQRYSRHYAESGSQIVLAAALPSLSVQGLQNETGYRWTEEFLDLYSHHDGVGIILQNGEIVWEFVPSVKLSEFAATIREWFSESHPLVAKSFHPFFDWGSGDAIGYLDLPEIPAGVLVEFEHENYEFEPGQPWREFLVPTYSSISNFLEV